MDRHWTTGANVDIALFGENQSVAEVQVRQVDN